MRTAVAVLVALVVAVGIDVVVGVSTPVAVPVGALVGSVALVMGAKWLGSAVVQRPGTNRDALPAASQGDGDDA